MKTKSLTIVEMLNNSSLGSSNRRVFPFLHLITSVSEQNAVGKSSADRESALTVEQQRRTVGKELSNATQCLV